MPLTLSPHCLERMRRLILLAMLPAIASSTPARAASIWIEGEDASTKRNTPHPWWYDKVKREVLSDGQWLSHFDKKKEGEAEYEITVTDPGDYVLWVRANPVKSKLSYRVDGKQWQEVSFAPDAIRGRMNIAKDNKPDLRFIAWVRVGKLALPAAKHQLEFRFHSATENHGAIDCLCLSNDGFVPSGTTKPSVVDEAAIGPGDWFPIIGDVDPFSDKSVVDISHLVEAPAGKYGFLEADGKRLRFSNSKKPVKFWAINSNLGGRDTPDVMELAARWYRKHGINLVRQHTVVGDVGLLREDGTFDPVKLDRYDRWFATLKKHGIYSTWSVIYPHHGPVLRKADGFDAARFAELNKSDKNRDGNSQPIVVNDFINLDRELQDIMLRHFKVLLGHKNTYTGLAYKDDPALAVVEFQNESNLFFHTLNTLRGNDFPIYSEMMRKGFFAFIKKKYRTKEAVAKAWSSRWDGGDNWEAGELGLMAPFHWGDDGPQYEFKGQVRRCGDYIEFLTGMQRGYYARRQKELREIGFKAVTVTTAWQGVGASSLANLYCDSAADMIDRHNYLGGGDGGHGIIEGKVSNVTHLNQPGRGLLNLGFFQTENQPFGVSEWTMMPPAPCKAEAAPLYAFYGLGLQGWDASYHFACSGQRIGDGWPGLSKYSSNTPHYMGQFPALAFAVHCGHVKEGAPVAIRRVGPKELYAGRDVLGQSIAHGSHDEKVLRQDVATPPEYMAIGRVALAFADGRSQTADVSRYWDKDNKILTSTTEQLRWHYGDRYVEVRTSKTQALIGFVGGTSIKLPDVRVAVKTPFVSLIFTPLDDADLAQSKHILITAMARDKQTGSEYNADWTELKTVGGPPLLMEPVQAKILFRGPKPRAINALDIYGVPTGKQITPSADGAFTINGRYQTYYYEVVR